MRISPVWNIFLQIGRRGRPIGRGRAPARRKLFSFGGGLLMAFPVLAPLWGALQKFGIGKALGAFGVWFLASLLKPLLFLGVMFIASFLLLSTEWFLMFVRDAMTFVVRHAIDLLSLAAESVGFEAGAFHSAFAAEVIQLLHLVRVWELLQAYAVIFIFAFAVWLLRRFIPFLR